MSTCIAPCLYAIICLHACRSVRIYTYLPNRTYLSTCVCMVDSNKKRERLFVSRNLKSTKLMSNVHKHLRAKFGTFQMICM